MSVKHYQPKELVITLGQILVEGIADGSFVEIDQNEDAATLYVGADGKGTRAMSNNRAATITLTLTQASLSNELLSVLHELDRSSGAGVRPLFIKDLNGTSLYSAATAWIKKQPKVTFSKGIETRQWIIETDDLTAFHGSAGAPPNP